MAEQIAVIEMDHQINAETLRKYLPKGENQQSIVLRAPQQESGGKDYSHEIGILYNMVMQNKKDLEELKELIHGERLEVRGYHEASPEKTPTITISHPDSTARKPIEAEDVESSLRIEDAEIDRIKRALEVAGGNRKVAADKLDISERTLYRKIKEYGL
jgi:DNA-binding NtrC family response regulator